MNEHLKHSRNLAYSRQQGLCIYCNSAMWADAANEFAHAHGLSAAQAKRFQCTAEHLIARQDGGNDSKLNIVAACKFCNQQRHRQKNPQLPGPFRRFVRSRMRRGKWHTLLFPPSD